MSTGNGELAVGHAVPESDRVPGVILACPGLVFLAESPLRHSGAAGWKKRLVQINSKSSFFLFSL